MWEILGASRHSLVHVSELLHLCVLSSLPFLFLTCFFVPNSQRKEKLRATVVADTTQLLCGGDRSSLPGGAALWSKQGGDRAALSSSSEGWALWTCQEYTRFCSKRKVCWLGTRWCDKFSILDSNLGQILVLPFTNFLLQLLPDVGFFLPLTENKNTFWIGIPRRLRANTWKSQALDRLLS